MARPKDCRFVVCHGVLARLFSKGRTGLLTPTRIDRVVTYASW